MKKIAIGFGIFLGLLVVAKSLGMIVNYTLPTTSMEPTLMKNSHLFTSNLVEHEVGDFIAFRPPLGLDEAQVYIKRLCAVAGDTIEMKNGVFYVNNQDFDENLTLQHAFMVDENTYKRINKKHSVTDVNVMTSEVCEIQIADQTAEAFNILDRKIIHQIPGQATSVFVDYEQSQIWTRDNFGPLIVPEGKVYAMGDNRHYSYDSRYFGFVDEEAITGVVLWK